MTDIAQAQTARPAATPKRKPPRTERVQPPARKRRFPCHATAGELPEVCRPALTATPGTLPEGGASPIVRPRSAPTRLILAVSGASGTPYALALAEALSARPDVELHLIVSRGALKVMQAETDLSPEALYALASRTYVEEDIAAPPASGSWKHAGMIVCPCSMASLAAIASGFGANLIHRAADVTLKERRPLILVVRETPFNRIHLENMLRAQAAGAVIMPASPGFYHRPVTAADMVRHFTGRILDQLGLAHSLLVPWGEAPQPHSDGGPQDVLHPDLARPLQLSDRHARAYRAHRPLVRRKPGGGHAGRERQQM